MGLVKETGKYFWEALQNSRSGVVVLFSGSEVELFSSYNLPAPPLASLNYVPNRISILNQFIVLKTSVIVKIGMCLYVFVKCIYLY